MTTSNLTIINPFNPTPSSSPMDWFSWLSKTNLEPSLIYDYGVTFARNQLELEDAIFFNHEILQSMGISIAKHRLEILKLAKKEDRGRLRPRKISGVIKSYLRKCVSKLVFREEASVKETSKEPNWHYQEKWREATVNGNSNNAGNNKPMYRSRTIALSGPLDGRMNEKVATPTITNKLLRLSGPLDGGRMSSPIVSRQMVRSPRSSGPLDSRGHRLHSRSSDARGESPNGRSPYVVNKMKGDLDYDEEDDHTLWPTLFQDLKPT